MNKNDTVTIEIFDVTEDGKGIGRYENTVVFVPFSAVGDTVSVRIIKVLKNYCVGKLIRIITTSKDRVTPDCEYFSKCGGCVYRHINYESELRLKSKRVEDCIRRIAKIDLGAQPIVSDRKIMRYRNKAQLPVGEGNAIGFFANHSHRIIEINDCLLQPELFTSAINALKKWMNETQVSVFYEQSGKGLLRHFYLRCSKDAKSIMAVIVINGDDIPDKEYLVSVLKNALGEKLKSVMLNINKKNNNVILGNENKLIFGEDRITDTICKISVNLSANSFYQVNRDMAELLYNKAKEYANPQNADVIDLYCGTGTIGLTMARDANSVIGVEIVEDAIKDAKRNAELNGIDNAEFICGDAAFAVTKLKERNIKPDVVILDPPRKGCDGSVLKIIAEDFCPKRIVYVSCNPATLARDVLLLNSLGYNLKEYTPFDLFPRTSHVETVCLLTSEKGQKRVEFSVDIEKLSDKTAGNATYNDQKRFVKDKYGSRYIAQTKQKNVIRERDNYYIGEGKSKCPECPPEKQKAIEDALRFFGKID